MASYSSPSARAFCSRARALACARSLRPAMLPHHAAPRTDSCNARERRGESGRGEGRRREEEADSRREERGRRKKERSCGPGKAGKCRLEGLFFLSLASPIFTPASLLEQLHTHISLSLFGSSGCRVVPGSTIYTHYICSCIAVSAPQR